MLVTLQPSWANRRTITCEACRSGQRLDELLEPGVLAEQVPVPWARELIERYAAFLALRGFSAGERWRKVRRAVTMGRRMGEELPHRRDLTDGWLDRVLAREGPSHVIRFSFAAFLRSENLAPTTTADQGWQQAITRGVSRVPQRFRRGVQIYTDFRVGVHMEQQRQQLRRVLALRTVAEDVRALCRFAEYLERRSPPVDGWDMVTEGDVVDYLLALDVNPNSRNIQRWDLNGFFSFAHRHRLVTHNPVPGEPGRESASNFRPLTLDRQRELLGRWARLDDPLESLVGCLGLLHGLGASQVRSLDLRDVDPDRRLLRVSGRPLPLPVDPLTMRTIESYLVVRPSGPAFEHNTHLVINAYSRFTGGPVSQRFLGSRLRPQRVSLRVLRMTCFATVAQDSGPRVLVDAFGLSPTQADRYQRFLAYGADQALPDLA